MIGHRDDVVAYTKSLTEPKSKLKLKPISNGRRLYLESLGFMVNENLDSDTMNSRQILEADSSL